MEKERWLDLAIEIQSIAQAGLAYTDNVYDKERYERLRDISVEMIGLKTELEFNKIKDLFCNEEGYQTPKIDTRAVIFKDNKILLVHENNDTWALPGGWCDVLESVGSNTIKEAYEETGLEVIPKKVIAIQDRNKHNTPVYAYGICKIFIECQVVKGMFKENIETLGIDYFDLDELPKLAIEKTSKEQIEMCFKAKDNDNLIVEFD